MDKEIANNRIVFDVREEGEPPPRGYKEMTAHMIFGLKIDYGSVRKARFVTDIHKVDIPNLMPYASLLSKDIFWIVLIMSALNVIDVKCNGVHYAYLNEIPKERVWL